MSSLRLLHHISILYNFRFRDAVNNIVAISLIININDINDESPEIRNSCPAGAALTTLTTTFAEDLAVGAPVPGLTYCGYDPDDGDVLTFTLIGKETKRFSNRTI